MMLPQKKSKRFLQGAKGFEMIAFIMEKHLSKWGMKSDKAKEFAEKYWQNMIDSATSGEVRLVLPHNLGYMQVLEHQYIGKDKDHLLKFGNVDYSLVWIRHQMFIHHRIKSSKKLSEEVKAKKIAGAKYLKDYVDGDTYVS